MSSRRGIKNNAHQVKARKEVRRVCITGERDDRDAAKAITRGMRSQRGLIELDALLAQASYEPPWAVDVRAKLVSGNCDRLCLLLINRLRTAIECRHKLIGPIQRKVRVPSPAALKWRANRDALASMQANRPLKPPGR
jgi:hypothetical protein